MDADRIVRDFCEAWGRGDLEAIMAAFTEDAVYHNIPMEAAEGKPAIEGFIKGFLAMSPSGVDFEIKNQVSSGSVVMNERIDTFDTGEKKISAPVCGIFEITPDGKISAWRDYFDMGHFGAGGDDDN
jgi:limonene-1,2-epoxide hydrolase